MSLLAYKGFESDLTCRGFQYEIGKTYTMAGPPEICKHGFHFCRKLIDVLSYYPMTDIYLYPICTMTNNRYCVVEVIGEIDEDNRYDSKGVTNQIKIVRELTKEEFNKITYKERIERDAITREILFGNGRYETNVH